MHCGNRAEPVGCRLPDDKAVAREHKALQKEMKAAQRAVDALFRNRIPPKSESLSVPEHTAEASPSAGGSTSTRRPEFGVSWVQQLFEWAGALLDRVLVQLGLRQPVTSQHAAN